MLLLKSSTLLSLIALFSCAWGTSPAITAKVHGRSKLDYNVLFPRSPLITRSPYTDVISLFSQTVITLEKLYYYWLISTDFKITCLPKGALSSFDAVERIDKMALSKEVSDKIVEHLKRHEPQKGNETARRHAERLNAWSKKYGDKLDRFNALIEPLKQKFSGEGLKILAYELAYFLNLISFKTSFAVLRAHRQHANHARILTNILGDSLLDGGKLLSQFYAQFETAVSTIGYLPEDLQEFEGIPEDDMAGTFRDTISDLVTKDYPGAGQSKLVKRMWRAACTLHLTATFQRAFGKERLWEKDFAQTFYQAIEVGKTEVFNSTYGTYNEDDIRTGGHNMLVEVRRPSDTRYQVKQFNSGDGSKITRNGREALSHLLIDT